MPNVTAGFEKLSDLMIVFGNLHILLHVSNLITSSNFYKICFEAEV